MLYYAARASFNVFLCSLQFSHRAGDIHVFPQGAAVHSAQPVCHNMCHLVWN